jgi:prepilin-type N-terminal cleavage/methylation domain-containing protein
MKTTKKAFSLIELLVTLALIAVMVGIAVGVYNNISKSAQMVAQNQDQQALQQVINSFKTSGGDMSSISTIRDPHEQAAALTALFQAPSSSVERPQEIWVAYN